MSLSRKPNDEQRPNPLGRFRLPLHLKPVGEGKHRAGWPFVMEHLRRLHDSEGILLDDFVERSFREGAASRGWREPWLGIFHHPPNLPEWFDPEAPLQKIFATQAFRSSMQHLRGAIALSEHLAAWLRGTLACPVLVLKHPTPAADLCFSFERWNQARRIIQVGWYARNIRAIYQLAVPDSFRKVHLMKDRLKLAMERTDRFSPHRRRPWIGTVEQMAVVDDRKFDELIASSVILCEYLDVSASNTVVEAIARSTPIFVNRLPALEEYLGAGYPLFFDDLDQVPSMLDEPARIRDASSYLQELDKSWMSAEIFAHEVARFVSSVSSAAQPRAACS
jgi:hypothetical protein